MPQLDGETDEVDSNDEDNDVVQEGVTSKIHRGFTLKTGGSGKSKTPSAVKSKTPAGFSISKTPIGIHSTKPV